MEDCRGGRKWDEGLVRGVEGEGRRLSGRSPKRKNAICSQILYLKMSKWESEQGNRENLGPKVSGRLWGRFWSALDPFLTRPSLPKASKWPEIQLVPPAGPFTVFTTIFAIDPYCKNPNC